MSPPHMPPKPIEDIDFPAIGEKILDLFCAIWEFICDLCLLVWAYVSDTFWTVWTYPPFESFRNDFVAALVGLSDYVVAHPVTSVAIALLFFVVIPAVLNALAACLLHSFGSRRRGILHGTYTVNYQSTSYGDSVARGSTFSRSQSQGAKGGHRAGGGTGYS